jgi:hypothetical protein
LSIPSWREAFIKGAVDALRTACRQIDDPAIHDILREIASGYAHGSGVAVYDMADDGRAAAQ